MDTSWAPEDDHFTVALRPKSPNGTPVVAVAWRGEDSIAVEFNEVLEVGADEYYLFTRETRLFGAPGDYPSCMPKESLEELLDTWLEHSFKHLPVIQAARAAGEFGGTSYSASQMKGVPFGDMFRRALLEFAGAEGESGLPLLTNDEVDLAAENSDLLALKGWTPVQIRAHLQQLQAVAVYVSALQEGSKPIQAVAETLGVNETRARNLIQFARENRYLTGGSQGKASGAATRAALDLANEVRERVKPKSKSSRRRKE